MSVVEFATGFLSAKIYPLTLLTLFNLMLPAISKIFKTLKENICGGVSLQYSQPWLQYRLSCNLSSN